MLGKLFKYEFRATARTFLPMYAILLAASVFARIFYTSSMDSNTPFVIVTLIMTMLFSATWVVTLVIILRRFWTNLLGREGYLTNVLPVAPWKHVFSKMCTSAVWCILGVIVSAASILIMVFSVPAISEFAFKHFARFVSEAAAAVKQYNIVGQSILFIVQLILSSLAAVFSFILMAYTAMSIGQLVNRHRVWASIGAYFGISIVQSIAVTGINASVANAGITADTLNSVYSLADAAARVNNYLFINLLMALIFCGVYFFVSSIILKKRLNLQ